jgi:hypothetical protein
VVGGLTTNHAGATLRAREASLKRLAPRPLGGS